MLGGQSLAVQQGQQGQQQGQQEEGGWYRYGSGSSELQQHQQYDQPQLLGQQRSSSEAGMVSVTFELPYKTAPGQRIEILGSLPELGGWYHDAAFPLQWYGGHIWRGSVQLPPGAVAEFKFLLNHPGGRWFQAGQNRRLEVPGDQKFVEVRCWWDSEAVAVLPVIPPDGDWKVAPPAAPGGQAASSGQLIRTVIALSVDEEDRSSTYRLVGSAPQMGSWNLAAAPTCRWAGERALACVVELPPGQVCDFKVARVSGLGEAEWQPGRNRSIATPFCSAKDFTLVASCSWSNEVVHTEIRQSKHMENGARYGRNGKTPDGNHASMREVHRLQNELQAAGQGITNAKQALQEKELELHRARQSSHASGRKIADMQKLVDNLKEKHLQLQKEWRESEGQLSSALIQQLEEAERDLKTERSRNEHQRNGAPAAQRVPTMQPSSARAQIESHTRELDSMKAQLSSIKEELSHARSHIADMRSELEATNAAHAERLAASEADAQSWLHLARQEGAAEVERVQMKLAAAEAALMRHAAERTEAEAAAQSALQVERARSAELSQQVDEQAARLASQVERHRAEGAKRDADIIELRRQLTEVRAELAEAQRGQTEARQQAQASHHRERRLQAQLDERARVSAAKEGEGAAEASRRAEADLEAERQHAKELERQVAELRRDKEWAAVDEKNSAEVLAKLEERVTLQWATTEELKAKLAETTESLQQARERAAAASHLKEQLAAALGAAEGEWEARLQLVEGASGVLRSRLESTVGELQEERRRNSASPPPAPPDVAVVNGEHTKVVKNGKQLPSTGTGPSAPPQHSKPERTSWFGNLDSPII
eukprot:jgi/Tetstr1/460738/TSEL_005923.t1